MDKTLLNKKNNIDSKDKLKVAVVQMTSTNIIQKNFEQFWELIKQVPQGVDMISTPENTFFIRAHFSDEIKTLSLDDSAFQKIADYAIKNNVFFHLGSVALQKKMNIYNATVVVTPKGEIYSPYDKVHLFDIHLEGQEPTNESSLFTHGGGAAEIEILGWKIGLSICYDIRFSELYSKYKNVDLILVPSAFLVSTGKAHWEVLLRARAIESQCYVVAAAQGGEHGGGRKTYGHSMVVEPWGTVILDVADDSKPSIHIVELEKSLVQKVRKQIPMHDHRRL